MQSIRKLISFQVDSIYTCVQKKSDAAESMRYVALSNQ